LKCPPPRMRRTSRDVTSKSAHALAMLVAGPATKGGTTDWRQRAEKCRKLLEHGVEIGLPDPEVVCVAPPTVDGATRVQAEGVDWARVGAPLRAIVDRLRSGRLVDRRGRVLRETMWVWEHARGQFKQCAVAVRGSEQHMVTLEVADVLWLEIDTRTEVATVQARARELWRGGAGAWGWERWLSVWLRAVTRLVGLPCTDGPVLALSGGDGLWQPGWQPGLYWRVTTLEMCADFAGFVWLRTDPFCFVGGRTVGEIWRWGVGGKQALETICVGKRSTAPLSTCLYDKTKEMRLSADGSTEAYEVVHREHGWNGVDRVMRVEFRLRGEALTYNNKVTGEMLCARDPAAITQTALRSWWAALTSKKRIIVPDTASRRERCVLDWRWTAVQAAVSCLVDRCGAAPCAEDVQGMPASVATARPEWARSYLECSVGTGAAGCTAGAGGPANEGPAETLVTMLADGGCAAGRSQQGGHEDPSEWRQAREVDASAHEKRMRRACKALVAAAAKVATLAGMKRGPDLDDGAGKRWPRWAYLACRLALDRISADDMTDTMDRAKVYAREQHDQIGDQIKDFAQRVTERWVRSEAAGRAQLTAGGLPGWLEREYRERVEAASDSLARSQARELERQRESFMSAADRERLQRAQAARATDELRELREMLIEEAGSPDVAALEREVGRSLKEDGVTGLCDTLDAAREWLVAWAYSQKLISGPGGEMLPGCNRETTESTRSRDLDPPW
jgi:hypothetical protein